MQNRNHDNILNFPTELGRAKGKETLVTLGAVLFIVLGIWSVYRHRVQVRLGYDPQQIGIAYNLSSAEVQNLTPEERKKNLERLSIRLESLRDEAERIDELSGYRVLSRRLARLQAIVDGEVSEVSEQLYLGRRISEFDQDLSALERDLGIDQQKS